MKFEIKLVAHTFKCMHRRETIDDEGWLWLHMGDIGLWLTGCHLKIVDRYMNEARRFAYQIGVKVTGLWWSSTSESGYCTWLPFLSSLSIWLVLLRLNLI